MNHVPAWLQITTSLATTIGILVTLGIVLRDRARYKDQKEHLEGELERSLEDRNRAIADRARELRDSERKRLFRARLVEVKVVNDPDEPSWTIVVTNGSGSPIFDLWFDETVAYPLHAIGGSDRVSSSSGDFPSGWPDSVHSPLVPHGEERRAIHKPTREHYDAYWIVQPSVRFTDVDGYDFEYIAGEGGWTPRLFDAKKGATND
jgi:hypothetical protein